MNSPEAFSVVINSLSCQPTEQNVTQIGGTLTFKVVKKLSKNYRFPDFNGSSLNVGYFDDIEDKEVSTFFMFRSFSLNSQLKSLFTFQLLLRKFLFRCFVLARTAIWCALTHSINRFCVLPFRGLRREWSRTNNFALISSKWKQNTYQLAELSSSFMSRRENNSKRTLCAQSKFYID